MNAQQWCFGGKYALGSGWACNPSEYKEQNMLRLGAEENIEHVITAHFDYLKKADKFENETVVEIDISNQLDATVNGEFFVGRYNGESVRADLSRISTTNGQTIATYYLDIID